ncbi:MAG: hypothetical protein GF316_20340 [Candidatus Lokiarchaeota archaeon]|nr:hypothetical protein [Candidatus Lokiarchaeota archaeon]
MAQGCIGTVLTMIGIIVIIGIFSVLGFTPISIILAIFIGGSIIFLDTFLIFGYKRLLKNRSKRQDEEAMNQVSELIELTKDENRSENFLVPINSSDIKSAIPSSQDITHSTLMKFKVSVPNSSEINYISHVLCTAQGIAWIMRNWKNEETQIFTHWYIARKIKPGLIAIIRFYSGRLFRDQKNESKIDFEIRKHRFFIDTITNALEYTKAEVKQVLEGSPDKATRTKRAKMLKFIRTYQIKLEKVKKKAAKKGYL